MIFPGEEHRVEVISNYINKLQSQFPNIAFKRIKKIEGLYITNPENKSLFNDGRIFIETQVKRSLSSCLSPFVSKAVKRKLSYFYLGEDKNDEIYKFDNASNLQMNEKYVIQNIGHATQLIQFPSFTILTDPVFGSLNRLFYPAKTESHPSIDNLPKVDIVLISHNHMDHVDRNSLCKLLDHHKAKSWPLPKVFVPMGDKTLFQSFGFKEIEEVEWFSKISFTKDNNHTVNFVSIPADHRSGRSGLDHHKSLVIGWVINPEQGDVIFKYSGDTRSLSDENQNAIDAILWNEIMNKNKNKGKEYEDSYIPDIICFEPSGPNYTRCDMDITHQSTSYSALLKFVEAENISKLSNRSPAELIGKIQTVMMHHNKFELGPDRFNEGLFVFKKLILYLDLSQEDLDKELERQNRKLKQNLDVEKLTKSTPFTSRPMIATLPNQTSLLVHAKNFIINDIFQVNKKLQSFNNQQVKELLIEHLKNNTKFLKIGERMNQEQLASLKVNVECIQKYNKKNATS